MSAANAGDVNADGFSDLIGAGRGQVRVWFGGSSPNSVPDLTLARVDASVGGAKDVDGDGIDDFLVGAPYDGAVGAGRVSVFWGGSAVDTVADLDYVGNHTGGRIGLCVAGGGRVDGPGPTDVIASAHEDPEQIGYNMGRVFVIANAWSPAGVSPVARGAGLSFIGAQPNPASGEVSLVLELDHSVPVRVTVYDVAGHEVARPVWDEWLVGRVTRAWRPSALPSGGYYMSATLGERRQVRKVVWLGDRR